MDIIDNIKSFGKYLRVHLMHDLNMEIYNTRQLRKIKSKGSERQNPKRWLRSRYIQYFFGQSLNHDIPHVSPRCTHDSERHL